MRKDGGGDSAPAKEDGPRSSPREDDDRGSKNAKGGSDDREDRRQDGGGKGGGRKNNSVFSGAATQGGDWKQRQDGRRPGGYNMTELEVFGESKGKNTSGIDFDSYDNIPVQITGNDVADIKPISRFSEAKLTDSLSDNLRRCGFDRPTPVQKNSIPIVVSGRDLMACAQTGSGKTCAFMTPCLESLLRSGPPPNPGSRSRPKPMPCGLCLAPTRELAAQIHQESLKFSFDTGIRPCIIYGGADMRDQRNDLEKGCDILIATPGRLTDMTDRGYLSLELIQFFILDEADRMLDMGFEPQVRQIVEKTNLGKNSRFPRQNMMFSATFPREVQRMAQDFMSDYVFITVGRVGSASELITQKVVYAAEHKAKVRNLENAIKDNLPKGGLAVIFVETKKSADSLELDLHQSGVAVTAIHGDRTQVEREEALAAFKSGSNPVLVATDVAARGLDIPNVALVVNFDMPKQIDDYVHRIGRTGRAGRKGVAVSFVNERCTYLPELGDLLVEAKQDPPDWFRDLCGSANTRGSKGKGRGQQKFGGQDLRMESGAASTNPGLAKAPTNSWSAPVRQAGSHGVTGAADAWDD
jgi:ATP-dependent RNA helicase DDX3X